MPTHLPQPSQGEQDQGLFFSTPELTQRLNLLRHLTENSDYIPVVKGGTGAGKTSMANRLQTLAADNWMLCRMEATPALHPNVLLGQCARCFGVEQMQGRSLEYLLQGLDQLRLAGRVPVLLIDDAHLLPPQTLLFLLGLNAQSGGDFPLVRVMLFADPQIDEVLATPRFESVDLQRLHSLQIPRLKEQHIADFVKFALGRDKEAEADAIPMDEVMRLYRKSGGIPGRVVALIAQQMAGKETDGTAARRPLPLKSIAGVSVLVLLLSLVLVYQDPINRLFEPKGSAGRQQPEPEPDFGPVSSFADGLEPAPQPAPGKVPSTSPPPSPVPGPKPQDIAKPQAPPPAAGSVPDKSVGASVEAVPESRAPAEKIPEASEAMTPVAPAEDVGQSEPVRVGAPPPPRGKADVKASAAATKPPLRSTEQSALATPAKRLSGSGPASATPVDRRWRREAWLLAQNPESYTIQLLGVRDEATLGRFIERHGLQDKAAYYASGGEGKPAWFSLLYGVYPDREAAETGRKNLPGALRKKDVWFRRMGAVQKEIRDKAR